MTTQESGPSPRNEEPPNQNDQGQNNVHSPEIATALNIARSLVSAGIPVFVAPPFTEEGAAARGLVGAKLVRARKLGFLLPAGWQRTAPDTAVVGKWQPGMALCMVTGRGFDGRDDDPRNNPMWPEHVPMPTVLGVASTPSGGTHQLIRSLGCASRNGIFPGIDLKANDGFLFIAPTVRASKDPSNPGQPVAYRWLQTPDIDALRRPDDSTGAPLRAYRECLDRATRPPTMTGKRQKRLRSAIEHDWTEGLTELGEIVSAGLARNRAGQAGWGGVYSDMLRLTTKLTRCCGNEAAFAAAPRVLRANRSTRGARCGHGRRRHHAVGVGREVRR